MIVEGFTSALSAASLAFIAEHLPCGSTQVSQGLAGRRKGNSPLDALRIAAARAISPRALLRCLNAGNGGGSAPRCRSRNPPLARRQLRRKGNLPPHVAALPQRTGANESAVTARAPAARSGGPQLRRFVSGGPSMATNNPVLAERSRPRELLVVGLVQLGIEVLEAHGVVGVWDRGGVGHVAIGLAVAHVRDLRGRRSRV